MHLRCFLIVLTLGASQLCAQTDPLAGGIRVSHAWPDLAVSSLLTSPGGDIIVIGSTTTPGLPTTSDAFQSDYLYSSCGPIIGPGFPNPVHCPNLYIARITPNGALAFATYLGSTGGVTLAAATLDSTGDLYLLGNAAGADFPLPLDSVGAPGTFLVRMRNSKLVLGHRLTLGADTKPARMVVDRLGNILLAGTTFGDLAATPGAAQPTSGGSFDAFVMKLNPAGQTIWATYLGGPGFDGVADLAVDNNGNVVVCGHAGQGFPVTPGAWNSVAPGTPLQSSTFVSILDPTGSRLIASALFGGESNDTPLGLAVTPTGDVLITGNTTSTQFPVTAGALQTAKLDLTTVFLVKLAADLSQPVFSTFLGGESSDNVAGLVTVADGSAILTGSTTSRFFPVTADSLERCNRTLALTLNAGFLAHISADGSHLIYASYFNLDDFGSTVSARAITPDGHVALAAVAMHAYDLSYYGGPVADSAASVVVRLDPEIVPQRKRFCVVNSASFGSGFATPGQLITLFGSNIGPDAPIVAAPDSTGLYPLRLGDTRVLIEGAPTALLYAGKGQVNAWLPQVNLGSTSTHVALEVGGAIQELADLRLNFTAPGFFRNIGFATAAALNEDGSRNSSDHLAPRGSLLTLYGSGFGATNPPLFQPIVITDSSHLLIQQPQIFFGPQPAQVVFAGQAPNSAPGLTAIRVRVPDVAPGLVPVNFSVGFNFALGNVSVWVQ